MSTSPFVSDILKLVSLRAASTPEKKKKNTSYLHDDRVTDTAFFYDNLGDAEGKTLADEVFYPVVNYTPPSSINQIKTDVQTLISNFENSFGMGDKINHQSLLDDLIVVIRRQLLSFDKQQLLHDVECVIRCHSEDKSITLHKFVYDPVRRSWFNQVKDQLFNRLYIQYIFKRKYPLSLENILTGLRALNVVYWLDHDNELRANENTKENAQGCMAILGLFLFMGQKSKDSRVHGNLGVAAKGDCHCEEPELPLLNTLTDLQGAFSSLPVIHPVFSYLYFYKKPFNPIRPIGIGDLKIVRQTLCSYVAGEVAHIENVLRGESKERVHRRLDRIEDIFKREEEKLSDISRDTQTTDRLEVKKQIESIVKDEIAVNADTSGSISGSYGLMQYNVAASAGFSYDRSTQDSTRSDLNFVKEIVDRSVSRVTEKTNEQRTITKVNELEETNRHSINNEKSKEHVIGIYRYVDKNYKAQLYNYGKRLMFEFIIPEPAFFYKSVFNALKKAGRSMGPAPTKPDFPGLQIGGITQSVADQWSATFSLSNVKPEPDGEIFLNEAFSNIDLPTNSAYEEAIQIREGYEARDARSSGEFLSTDGRHCVFQMNIGNKSENKTIYEIDATRENKVHFFNRSFADFGGIEGKVLVSLATNDVPVYAINVTIRCTLKPEKKREWQIDTYNKIMDAYDNKLKDYESKLAEYENKIESMEARDSGIEIKGKNPGFNLEIIKAELKKHAVTLITKDYDTNTDADEASNQTPIGLRAGRRNVPAINIDQTKAVAPVIQFLEQAFEWRNLTYLLYPYFWQKESKWIDSFKSYDEIDPVFAAFLRAGAARILVPVYPSYETAVMHYLYTQEVWNGGEAPVIGDDLYVPIHEEIHGQQDDLNGAVPEGEPWEYTVPTPLICLQQSSELPKFDCSTKLKK
jgi:hypothetical protein